MSYYILPKINSQIEINPSTTSNEDLLKPYISHSLLHYISLIKLLLNLLKKLCVLKLNAAVREKT